MFYFLYIYTYNLLLLKNFRGATSIFPPFASASARSYIHTITVKLEWNHHIHHHINIYTNMLRRGIIEIISYYISSLSYKIIHRQFKSTYVITIKSYLFGWLLNSSKQKTSKNRTTKIIENGFKQLMQTLSTHSSRMYLTLLEVTCRGLNNNHNVRTYMIST